MIIDNTKEICEFCGEKKEPWSFQPYEHEGIIYYNCNKRKCTDKEQELRRKKERIEEKIKNIERKEQETTAFINSPSYVMNQAGISKKYHFSTLDNFIGGDKYIKVIRDWLENPISSLYIYGTCGSGKTHLVSAIIRELFIQDIYRSIRFKGFSDLLLDIRDSFNKDSKQTEYQIVEKCITPKIMVIDDIGAEKVSEFSISTLYVIINTRLNDEKITIVTSNLSRAQFEKQIDNRIASRFAEYKAIHLDMPDYRKKV